MRKPRADSVRNRERLLHAAATVFSKGSADASLEAVARQAEVGIGTLYRHFPTREALFQAVYSREVDELVNLANELASEPDTVSALRRWMHCCVRMVATKRGMLSALTPKIDGADSFYADASSRQLQALSRLMAPGVETGQLRNDITSEELMRAFLGICYMREQPMWQETVIRLLDVLIDGLAVGPKGGQGDAE